MKQKKEEIQMTETIEKKGISSIDPRSINEIDKLKQWIFERVSPFAAGNILEIGSGSGNISELFIQSGTAISLSDPNARHCKFLNDRFDGEKCVQAIMQIDLQDENFDEKYSDLLEQFDTVISLNISDHASYDQAALSNAKKLLKQSGYLIVLEPAYFALYGGLEQGFSRWHKYNRQRTQKLLGKDFKIVKTKYFNLAGIVKSYLASGADTKNLPLTVKKNSYKELVPTFYVQDLAFKQIGLSAITMAEKIN